MIKWVKPSGAEIETNDRDETIEAAVKLGWELADKPKPKKEEKPTEEAPKKRGRKPKAK